jgi:hypothetical protein
VLVEQEAAEQVVLFEALLREDDAAAGEAMDNAILRDGSFPLGCLRAG